MGPVREASTTAPVVYKWETITRRHRPGGCPINLAAVPNSSAPNCPEWDSNGVPELPSVPVLPHQQERKL